MNILMISSYYPKPHNRVMGIWAHEQARVLKRRGNNVVVISPTPWIPKFNFLPKKILKWSEVPKYEVYDGIDIFHLKIPQWPQVGILNRFYNIYPNIRNSIAYLCLKARIKQIIKDFNIEIIHAHSPTFEGVLSYHISKELEIPFCITENSAWDPVHALNHHKLERIYRFILDQTDHIIPVSQLIKNNLLKYGQQYSDKMTIVHPGVDIEKTKKIHAIKPSNFQDSQVILSIGVLEERKGHEILVEAIGKIYKFYPKLKCIIIGGNSTEEKNIKDKISELNLNTVIELKGQFDHVKALEYISWCDLFVLPSWFEAFGVVFAESMAYGKPIIGVQGEGISDVIENNKNGLLVPKKDVHSLAIAIRKILDDKKFASEVGENGRVTVNKYLTWDFNATCMEECYSKMLNSK